MNSNASRTDSPGTGPPWSPWMNAGTCWYGHARHCEGGERVASAGLWRFHQLGYRQRESRKPWPESSTVCVCAGAPHSAVSGLLSQMGVKTFKMSADSILIYGSSTNRRVSLQGGQPLLLVFRILEGDAMRRVDFLGCCLESWDDPSGPAPLAQRVTAGARQLSEAGGLFAGVAKRRVREIPLTRYRGDDRARPFGGSNASRQTGLPRGTARCHLRSGRGPLGARIRTAERALSGCRPLGFGLWSVVGIPIQAHILCGIV